MPRSCRACGGGVLRWLVDDDELVCPHCWATGPQRHTMLVVTGAAATGKSTVATHLFGVVAGATFLDGDVIAEGASAVHGDRRDFGVFWGYVLRLGHEIAANGSTPVICGIGLPKQVEANAERGWFRTVEYLALVCEPDELERRIVQRRSAGDEVERIAFHLKLNATIQQLAGERPDMEQLDVTHLDVVGTVERARAWIAERIPSRER